VHCPAECQMSPATCLIAAKNFVGILQKNISLIVLTNFNASQKRLIIDKVPDIMACMVNADCVDAFCPVLVMFDAYS